MGPQCHTVYYALKDVTCTERQKNIGDWKHIVYVKRGTPRN